MEYHTNGEHGLLVLAPGDELMTCLTQTAATNDIEVALIVSGVGMLSRVKLGFFCVESDDYNTTELEGIFDINSIIGNICQRDGKPWPHVHATFNAPDHKCFGGHILEAKCHITMEVGIQVLQEFQVKRAAVSGFPATRIIRQE